MDEAMDPPYTAQSRVIGTLATVGLTRVCHHLAAVFEEACGDR